MTKRQLLRILEAELNKFPTRWKAAESFGISESSLSKVMRGLQEPGPAILDRLGLTSQVVYIKKHKTNHVVNGLTVDTEINIPQNFSETKP
jgi:molybdopterin-biosynthesis enzyme MoeA-like protein